MKSVGRPPRLKTITLAKLSDFFVVFFLLGFSPNPFGFYSWCIAGLIWWLGALVDSLWA